MSTCPSGVNLSMFLQLVSKFCPLVGKNLKISVSEKQDPAQLVKWFIESCNPCHISSQLQP